MSNLIVKAYSVGSIVSNLSELMPIIAHTVMTNEAGDCVAKSATANDASAPP